MNTFNRLIIASCVATSLSSIAEEVRFDLFPSAEQSIHFEENYKEKLLIDAGYKFDEISSISINFEPISGNAQTAAVAVKQELTDPCAWPVSALMPAMISYSAEMPSTPGEIVIPTPDDFSIEVPMQGNFLDGESEVELSFIGGSLSAQKVEVVIVGSLSETQVNLTLDEDDGFTVPYYGGRVEYDAMIQNLDSSGYKNLKQFSTLKTPSGDYIPVHKLREFGLDFEEKREFTRTYLNIPAWYETGEYELIWTVLNPETGKRVQDSLKFTKADHQ